MYHFDDVIMKKKLDNIMSMSLMPLADSADPYSNNENENGIYLSYQMIMILYHHLVEPSTRS